MGKDAYWFKHDSNASRDLKLTELRAIYGYEGIGIFWAIIEVLREQKGYGWDEKKVQILAKILDVELSKLNNIIFDCKRLDLFRIKSNCLYSKRLVADMEVWESKKKNRTKHERNANGIATKTEDKRRVEKSREEKSISGVLPTLEMVKNYCLERKNQVDPEKWFDFYSSKGWMIGKNKMKDWKAAVRTWEIKKEEAKPTW